MEKNSLLHRLTRQSSFGTSKLKPLFREFQHSSYREEDSFYSQIAFNRTMSTGSTHVDEQQVGGIWQGDYMLSLSLSGNLNYWSPTSTSPVRVIHVCLHFAWLYTNVNNNSNHINKK